MVAPARQLNIPYFAQLKASVVRTRKELATPRAKFNRQVWSTIPALLTLMFIIACIAPLSKQANRTLVSSIGAIAQMRVRLEIAGSGCIDHACQQA